jgi:hypothetical protein
MSITAKLFAGVYTTVIMHGTPVTQAGEGPHPMALTVQLVLLMCVLNSKSNGEGLTVTVCVICRNNCK